MNALPEPGTTFGGKYRIEGLLGQGGMSNVLAARHIGRDAPVAIKLVRAEPGNAAEAVARLGQEAIAASRLSTDHVVHVHDVGALEDGTPYLVMERLGGEDMESLLSRQGTLETPRAVHLVLQLLRALAVAHEAGVVHRDVKPSNLNISVRDGEPEFLKLLDFGISKIHRSDDTRLTLGTALMGTPLYMAPEQVIDARLAMPASDLYSVGVILFEILSGVPPLMDDDIASLLVAISTQTPPRLDRIAAQVPAKLADVVMRALQKKPADRFAGAREMAAALKPFADARSARVLVSLEHEPPSSEPSQQRMTPPAHRPSGDLPTVALTQRGAPPARSKLGLTALVLVSLVATGAGSVLLLRDARTDSANAMLDATAPMPPSAVVSSPATPLVPPSSSVVPVAASALPAAPSAAVPPKNFRTTSDTGVKKLVGASPARSNPFDLELIR